MLKYEARPTLLDEMGLKARTLASKHREKIGGGAAAAAAGFGMHLAGLPVGLNHAPEVLGIIGSYGVGALGTLAGTDRINAIRRARRKE